MKETKCKIYVIQMHTKTIPSRLIKLFTRYKYSHMAISFNRDCKIIYSFGRRKYNSILNSGFVCEHQDGLFFQKFKDTRCRIFEIEVSKKQYLVLKNIIKKMKNNNDIYKYDYLGIFLRYFKIPITFKNKYVCSYFIAKLLEDAKIYKFNKKTYFIEPKDFEFIDCSNLIYSGKYLLYR